MLSTPRGCLSTLEPMQDPVAFRRIAGEMAKPALTVHWLSRFRLEIYHRTKCVLWILKFYRKVLKCSFNLTLMFELKSSYEPFCSDFNLSLKMTKRLIS